MRRRLVLHTLLLVLGLLGPLWALTWGANPVIVCHGVVMHPGDTCANADGGQVQTYEQRWNAAQGARPVIGVVGSVVAVFAAGLLRAEVKSAQPAAKAIGP